MIGVTASKGWTGIVCHAEECARYYRGIISLRTQAKSGVAMACLC